jgi:DNA mismatch repair protein MutS2
MMHALVENPCPEKTRADLEWDRLTEALASRCEGVMGKALARDLDFAPTRAETRARLARSEEATRLYRKAEPLPAPGLADVREAIDRLGVNGVLAGVEIRAIGKMLESARTLRRFLASRRANFPALAEALTTDPTLDSLCDEIDSSFDADGTLSDRASPRLKELRGEQQQARARILSRLDDLMNRYEGVLQDKFVTEREGRYVLPLRSDAHERFPGLVHSASSSGSTIFVEPRAVISLGNRLKMLDAHVEREELAVYTRLSSLLSDQHSSIEACRAAMALADLLSATAKLAHELKLDFVNVVDEPAIDLKDARHFLLAIDQAAWESTRHVLPKVGQGIKVVPSDLKVSGAHAVVVSGPNAGGKTVALKTMGLCALATRAGIPLPCAPESTIGIFDIVLTDVGDDQSITKNLSTFSAHISNVVRILSDSQPGALVLLDELAGGTDPREGEALAAGILDSLCARGAAVVATTHYEGLKALALADPRFENASCGFDIATMTPTFRISLGIPGKSSALAVARQFGMPSTVTERAEKFLTREDRNFDAVVEKMHEERAALELARAAAQAREAKAEETRVRLEEEIEKTRAREEKALSRDAEALLNGLRRAKEDLRAAQAKLRGKKIDEASLKEASRAIDRVAGSVAIGGELERLVNDRGNEELRNDVAKDELKRGAKVYVPRLRAIAEVLDVQGDDVRVTAGSLKMTLHASELREALAAEKPSETPKKKAFHGGVKKSNYDSAPLQTHDTTCDLRGLRVDEALSKAVQFLDRSVREKRDVAFLVHGHGTGALRESIRAELAKSPYVAYSRSGTHDEGGEGVTVVWLA